MILSIGWLISRAGNKIASGSRMATLLHGGDPYDVAALVADDVERALIARFGAPAVFDTDEPGFSGAVR